MLKDVLARLRRIEEAPSRYLDRPEGIIKKCIKANHFQGNLWDVSKKNGDIWITRDKPFS